YICNWPPIRSVSGPPDIARGGTWRNWIPGWTNCSVAWSSCGGFFDLDRKLSRLQDLEARQGDPSFWADAERAREQVQEVKRLKGWVTPYRDLEQRLADAADLLELLSAEPDPAMQADLEADITAAAGQVERLELQTMLQGPDDGRGAILTIHPGAGGTESQDWAEMLMRMYVRWAERKGFDVSVLDLMPGEEAGIKSATIEIAGEYAYGFLKAEKGVHRLVRISPYDSQKRRHTSFASVFVYPDIDDSIEIDLREEDIEMDVFRASGAGGQHVNKTSSAVRLTHVPTGIVVSCQQERSQFKNRDVAMKMLRAALYQRELEKQQAAKDALEATKSENSFGSQIRSYVFQPYTMVNDHRTERKVSDVQGVMDGDLDEFIEAYLKRFGEKAA
ncbi:MAG TPA: peptide chain release factor 2, partial [Gemmatimonadales bacterium]|nr:peptide chain release factor 2 [Gemmatimonadales bacterium]